MPPNGAICFATVVKPIEDQRKERAGTPVLNGNTGAWGVYDSQGEDIIWGLSSHEAARREESKITGKEFVSDEKARKLWPKLFK